MHYFDAALPDFERWGFCPVQTLDQIRRRGLLGFAGQAAAWAAAGCSPSQLTGVVGGAVPGEVWRGHVDIRAWPSGCSAARGSAGRAGWAAAALRGRWLAGPEVAGSRNGSAGACRA